MWPCTWLRQDYGHIPMILHNKPCLATEVLTSVIHDVTVDRVNRAADLGRCSLKTPSVLHLFGATHRRYQPRSAVASGQDRERSRLRTKSGGPVDALQRAHERTRISPPAGGSPTGPRPR